MEHWVFDGRDGEDEDYRRDSGNALSVIMISPEWSAFEIARQLTRMTV